MLNIFLLFTAITLFPWLSVKKAFKAKSIPAQQAVYNEFAGKLFFLGQGFGEIPCVIENECDCCNSNLLFISANEFILNELCEGSESVTKGKYKVEGKVLTLIYEPLIINYNYNWEIEVNPKAQEYTFEIIKKPISPTKYQLEKCNGKTILALRKKGGDEFGKFDPTSNNAEKIKELKEKGIWKKLGFK